MWKTVFEEKWFDTYSDIFNLVHVPSTTMEEVGFMTYTAASHQEAIELSCPLSLCTVSGLEPQSSINNTTWLSNQLNQTYMLLKLEVWGWGRNIRNSSTRGQLANIHNHKNLVLTWSRYQIYDLPYSGSLDKKSVFNKSFNVVNM